MVEKVLNPFVARFLKIVLLNQIRVSQVVGVDPNRDTTVVTFSFVVFFFWIFEGKKYFF